MKAMTVTEVARNFRAVMDAVESEEEEIVVIRNHKPIARLVPESPEMTAIEVLGDLYKMLDDGTAEALTEAIANRFPPNANRHQQRCAGRIARMDVDRRKI